MQQHLQLWVDWFKNANRKNWRRSRDDLLWHARACYGAFQTGFVADNVWMLQLFELN